MGQVPLFSLHYYRFMIYYPNWIRTVWQIDVLICRSEQTRKTWPKNWWVREYEMRNNAPCREADRQPIVLLLSKILEIFSSIPLLIKSTTFLVNIMCISKFSFSFLFCPIFCFLFSLVVFFILSMWFSHFFIFQFLFLSCSLCFTFPFQFSRIPNENKDTQFIAAEQLSCFSTPLDVFSVFYNAKYDFSVIR